MSNFLIYYRFAILSEKTASDNTCFALAAFSVAIFRDKRNPLELLADGSRGF